MNRQSTLRPLFGYLLRAAIGRRFVVGLIAALLAATLLAAFLGSAALVERRAFAAVLGANAARLAVVLFLTLFTCFHVRRAFESREVELLLSRPVSRRDFVLAHVALLSLLAAAAALLAGISVAAVADAQAWASLAWWTGSLFVEALLVGVAALFFALTLQSGVLSALAALGLYVLGRTIGLLAGIAAAQAGHGLWERVIDPLVGLLALVVPRLDLLARSAWLVHGAADDAGLAAALVQNLVYVVLLAAAASFDFARRQL